jgi:hypothetical protein
MTDPYELLGETLTAAAERQEIDGRTRWSVRAWLSRRLNATVMTLALVLGGGAIAVAATGVLNGSPVGEPEGSPSPNSGTGVPAAGGSHLQALRVPDPEGGLPWGMRLVHTTRGEVCVQIGRIHDGQLGQLGIDGAFHDDGRFHPLSPDILPNFTNGYANISCILPGQTLIGVSPTQDRNAEWMVGPRRVKPMAQDLRSISYGLLGPHAVSIAYRTTTGTQTRPVSPGTGAYMIVQPVGRPVPPIRLGEVTTGWVSGHEVSADLPAPERFSVVRTITYRFGSEVCSVGNLVPAAKRCPAPPSTPESAYQPTRSLHEPVHVTAVRQSHKSCSAPFLLYPCYRAEVEFKAPYAITSAAGEYEVAVESTCHNARPSGWAIIHNIKQDETVRTLSLGYFNCTSTDEFEVRYLNRGVGGPSAAASHESVIVGAGTLGGSSRAGAIPMISGAERVSRARGDRPERARDGSR